MSGRGANVFSLMLWMPPPFLEKGACANANGSLYREFSFCGPFVYRLGRLVFNQERGVRLP